MSSEVNTYDDDGALTLVPVTGGEVWVEPTPEDEDRYQIGAECEENSSVFVIGLGYVRLTRDELAAFRDLINKVLEVEE